MQPSDTGAHQPHLGAEKTRGRPRGHHGETVRQGREVREALEQGIPLGVQVANLLSHGIISDAKTLRRRLKAANKTDDLPSAARRSSSPAVTHALQRFRARSAAHRRYELYDASSVHRRAAPSDYWESLAALCELRAELERAMADASGRLPKDWATRQECLAVVHRAHAERLRRGAG